MLLAAVCLTLTSCLDSSSDSYTPQGYGLVEVVNYMGTTCFKASNGLLIYPTAESLANVETNYSFKPSTTNVAYIGYQYSSDVDLTNVTSATVTLTYAVSVDGTSEEVYEQGDLNDSISTSPIITLYNVMDSSSESQLYLFNDRYLVTGIQYYFYQYAHYFTLVCYPNEQDDETVLKLYLRHTGNVENTSVLTTSYDAYSSGYPYIYFKAFDISYFDIGPKVKTIEVHADVASLNTLLSNAEEKVFTLAYNN
jgi:hypothetical protein